MCNPRDTGLLHPYSVLSGEAAPNQGILDVKLGNVEVWSVKGLSPVPGGRFLAGRAIRSPLPTADSDPRPHITRVLIDFHEAALVLHDQGI